MNPHANGPARRPLFLGAVIFVSLCWTAVALAQSSERQYDLNIAPLPLSQALLEFGKQTELQLFYSPDDKTEESAPTGGLKGRYTAQQALEALLPDGFTFVWTNSRTVTVLSPPVNSPPGGVNEAVAAKDQQRSELSKGQQLSMENGGGKGGSSRGPYAFEEKMLVEASRILFDTLDLDVPITVMDRERIKSLGASTVTDLFRYVPQQTHTMGESFLGDGTQFADLRGLGFDTTLVLINGHRTIPTASSLSFNAFDLNSIPLGAVERVEIVSDSTSAMHGADAIGGVVNIVLREDVPEPTLDFDYGAAAGGAVERHAAFSASGSRGRARGSIVLDYFDRSALLGDERSRWNNQDFTRFGSMDWRSPTAPAGNVSSVTPDNLPGLPSTFAAIPDSAPNARLTPADFLATAGRRNLESLYKYQTISAEGTRKGVMAQGDYGWGPHLTAYGEFLYVARDVATAFEPPALSGALVPRTNPYNPFDEDVLVDVLLADLGPRFATRSSELVRAVGGVRGRLRGWDWDVALHRSEDEAETVRTNDLDPARVAAALAETDPETALNVFGGSGANSRVLLESLLAAPARSHYRSDATQATASLRGAPFSLPMGSVEVITGAEWRREGATYQLAEPADLAGSHHRTVAAAFGEVRVPLVSEMAKVPAAVDLYLVLAGRLDDYSDIGDSFSPEFTLVWRPVAALTWRTSLARSFRPPPLFDLYLPAIEQPVPTVDPARGDEFAFPIWRGGGNTDLKPSTAKSLTTTLKFTPPEMPGLSMAATYWRIRIDDTITIPQAAQLLAAESRFPGRIVRGAPSAADVAAGIPGPLELVDVTRMNFGSVDTSGIDLSGSAVLETDMGRFEPTLAITWIHDFATSDLIQGSDFRRVGVANLQGSVPQWRAVGGVSWSRHGFGASGTVRYVPSYDDVDAFGVRNERRVGAQTLVDAQLSLDIGNLVVDGSAWDGIEIRIGMLNALDSEPPFAEVYGPSGYDLSQGDLRQRFAYLKLTKKF